MRSFPFISLRQALVLLRIATAAMFLAHAVVRICNGSIPQFSGYLADKGFPYSTPIVWLITAFEIIGGIALCLGYFVRWFSFGFVVLLLIGIIIIHFSAGWFVGEHGSGGMEYSVALIFALITIAAADRQHR
jgi:putative oxidoreductase